MAEGRGSVWILGDQLLEQHPALTNAEREHGRDRLRVVLVESVERTRKFPYQRKKLVLVFSAMRHYAKRLRAEGYAVDYVQAPSFQGGLRQHVAAWQPDQLFTMAASEYDTRRHQEKLAEQLGVPVSLVPNSQFLVGEFDPYPDAGRDKRVVMEYFYRAMRRHFQVLMDGHDQPLGGQWNYDQENRKPLPEGVQPPKPASFQPDAITKEVMSEVEAADHGVGTVVGFDLAVTRQQALAAVRDFVAHRLAEFGPYEDAMSSQHRTLYHSVLSPYLNIGLLEPRELVLAVERAYDEGQAPINSVEGFVRQVLGWREYVYWQYWRLMPELAEANAWRAERPVPAFFWDGQTEMNCLGRVIRRVINTGYSHHIERLMLICNYCLLAGINPALLNKWFLSFYIDAYEWVMVPNVIGMGLNADGGLVATKPYVASANYINRMGDYCLACRFDRRSRTGPDACPYNFLYWNFLLKHEPALRANPRLGRNVLGLRHLGDVERTEVRRQAADFLDDLDGT